MLKYPFIAIITACIVFSSMWNICYSIISFIATNITIRESNYFDNEVMNKGTHSGGKYFINKTKEYKYLIASMDIKKIYKIIVNHINIDPKKTNFQHEHQLISVLKRLGKLPNADKRDTAIYIPKKISTYWNISCDSHLAPFLVPAISNIALIDGLPIRDKTCYGHLKEYGYYTYFIRGIKPSNKDLNKKMICIRAKQNKFNRVIEINNDNNNNIISIYHECKE